MKTNTSRKNKTCPHCGKTFYAHREDTKYCSATCRSAAWRQKPPRKNIEAIKRDDPELSDPERFALMDLIYQLHKTNFRDFEEEFWDRLWAIEAEYECYEWVMEELKFRLKYAVSEEDYRTMLDKVWAVNEQRNYLTEDDLRRFYGYVPMR